MSLTEGAATPRRRRGTALENALLEAAWDEIVEKGYDGFTIESVAERAQTARAVIYRRWATKSDLVRAAIAHHGQHEHVPVPDTGSLRGDLVELLRSMNRRRAPLIGILLSARIDAFSSEMGASLSDLRDEFLRGRTSIGDHIFARAVARGEVDPAALTPRVRTVVYDLYRHEVLMTHRAVPDDVIDAIVDEVALPLLRR